jgi:hypothetical protein
MIEPRLLGNYICFTDIDGSMCIHPTGVVLGLGWFECNNSECKEPSSYHYIIEVGPKQVWVSREEFIKVLALLKLDELIAEVPKWRVKGVRSVKAN